MEKNDVINGLINQWHNDRQNQSNLVPAYRVRQWLERQKDPELFVGDVWRVRNHAGAVFSVFLFRYHVNDSISGVGVQGQNVNLDEVEFLERLLHL